MRERIVEEFVSIKTHKKVKILIVATDFEYLFSAGWWWSTPLNTSTREVEASRFLVSSRTAWSAGACSMTGSKTAENPSLKNEKIKRILVFFPGDQDWVPTPQAAHPSVTPLQRVLKPASALQEHWAQAWCIGKTHKLK